MHPIVYYEPNHFCLKVVLILKIIPGNVYKVQNISPNVGNIHMKQQTNPHVVEIKVTNLLKDKGQTLLEVATQAHVFDGKQKGDLVVMKPPTTKKELHMEIANEDDGNA